ncbi:MAG: cytochrome c oxidase assembly protein [Rhodospirillales bacterium]
MDNGAKRRKRLTATVLTGVVAGMVGLTFASVPLYRMFCQATGYDGTPRTDTNARPDKPIGRAITVHFDANVNPALPWQFQPEQRLVRLNLGEQTLAFYRAHNTSGREESGTATFNVVPEAAAPYFTKTECFCFTEQTLAADQTVDMPVAFFVDPGLDDDPEARGITDITLSYTFFRVPEAARTAATAEQGSGVPRQRNAGG